MRTKMKIPLFSSFLIAIGLLIIPTSCEEDYETIKEPLIKNKNLRIEVHQGEHTLNENPFLRSILSDVKTKKEQSRLISTTYNFAIEEELVQVLTGDDYIQYTFVVERENPQENVLENYVCKIMNNGLIYQYIIQYPYTLVNGDKNYIASQTHIIPIQNPDFVNTTSFRINCPPGSVPYLVDTSEQEICYSIGCSGGEGHSYGDTECPCGKTLNCAPARLECNTTTVYNWSCGGGGGTGDGNTGDLGTSGGSGTTDNSDSTTTTTVPFDDSRSKAKECKKIKDGLDNNPAFKTKIQNLSTPANLNLNYEKAAGTFEGSNAISEWQGVGSSSNEDAYVDLTYNLTDKFTAFFHTHPAIGSGTLACFSDGDLAAIATLIRTNNLKTDTFVAYLATKKGTYLALTITNPTKFLDLFYSKTFPPSGVGITTNDWPKVIASEKALEEPLKKYYDPKNKNRLIKETDTDTENVLKQFLNFLKEADAGVALFETDATFSTFTRLELTNPTTINRSNICN
jgi:hypothetical protein